MTPTELRNRKVTDQLDCRHSVATKNHRWLCVHEELCLDRETAIHCSKLMPQYACAGAIVSADQGERRTSIWKQQSRQSPSFRLYQNKSLLHQIHTRLELRRKPPDLPFFLRADTVQ